MIELHREANRPVWLAAPDPDELLELTRASATGVAGLSAPVPAAHAVLLAAHSWAHEPLRRLLDLIDVTVVLEDEDDRRRARELAFRWGLGRVWRTTIAAADALLGRLGFRAGATHLGPSPRRHPRADRVRDASHALGWTGLRPALQPNPGAWWRDADLHRCGPSEGRRALDRRHAPHASGDCRRVSSPIRTRPDQGDKERTMTLRLRTEDLEWREIDSDIVILDGREATYLTLNGSGALLWRLLATDATRERVGRRTARSVRGGPSDRGGRHRCVPGRPVRAGASCVVRRPPDLASLRAAWWARTALRAARRALARGEIREIRLPAPPPLPASAVRGVNALLRRREHDLSRARARPAAVAGRARRAAPNRDRRDGAFARIHGARLAGRRGRSPGAGLSRADAAGAVTATR